MMPRHDLGEVIVIGAGAAGLAAGRRLAGAGKQVIILEARERIGGRIHTQRADQGKVPMELGAEFIHGLPTDSWSLIREAQLPTVELRGKAFCFDAQRLTVCDDRQHESFSVLEQMETWLEQRRSASDVTFEGYLRAAGVESSRGDLAAAYVEGFNAADRHIISATALVRQQRAEEEVQGDRIFHIRSGYDSLPQFLAEDSLRSGARIILGCPVRRIRWHRNSVSVEGCAADGAEFHFEAAQAVVALPLGVLQSNAVIFDPEPGEMARHWQSLRMGNAERIVLLFDRCFWSDVAPGQGFLFTPGEIFPTWWTAAPESTPLLTGWAGGAAAMARWQQAGMTKLEDLLPAALKTLAKVYGVGERQLQSWLVDSKFHNWQSDPFSRGAYSYVGLGGWEAARLLSDPVDDTLFFAGEHTDLNDQWGTVHAALSSGERAARQLLTKEPRRS